MLVCDDVHFSPDFVIYVQKTLRYHPTAFTTTAHLINHPRLNKVPGDLVWELLKSADLKIHGPNTPDTHPNPPLAMLVADLASWSQYLSDRIWIWLHHSGTAKGKKLVREMQPNATLVLCTWPLLCSPLQKCAPQNPIIISCQMSLRWKCQPKLPEAVTQ